MSRANKDSRPHQAMDGGGKVNKETTTRQNRIDAEVAKATEGGKRTDAATEMIKQGKSPLEAKRTDKQKRDLRIQLSDAGISETKNSARDKLRLRKIREGKK